MDRRHFLGSAAGVSALFALGQAAKADECFTPAPFPADDLYGRNEDEYWAKIREQFLIPRDEVYLNNGTVGSSPRPVLKAVFDGFMSTERMDQENPEEYPIWGYEPYVQFRGPLAAFLGAKREQIALVRNATEANSYIANGLELKAGDEVLISDQEHPGGEEPWNLRAKRYGIVVRKFTLPKPPKSAAEILNIISDAITPQTRVLFFSHITTVTGVVMPAKEICALARSKGIISAVDGAHVPGMMKLDLNDLDCDLYSASPHKWLQAPKGTGFLFLRDDAVMNRMWNTIVTHGWNEPELKAERFQHIGSSNVPMLWGLKASLDFANRIGLDRIERRHRQMANYILKEMTDRGVESWTSADPALRCAITTVNVASAKMPDLENWMWKTHKIRIRGGAPSKIRLSTPYYLLRPDIQRFLTAFDQYRKTV